MAIRSSVLAASKIAPSSATVHHYDRHHEVTRTWRQTLLPSNLQHTRHLTDCTNSNATCSWNRLYCINNFQWRSQDSAVWAAQGVWGTEVPQRGPAAEPPPERSQHITNIWLPNDALFCVFSETARRTQLFPFPFTPNVTPLHPHPTPFFLIGFS